MSVSAFLWDAAGRPWPCETTGEPLVAPKRVDAAVCAMCGEPAPAFRFGDAFSTNFWPARTVGRLFPFGGDGLCIACVWSARTLALRCAAWFATERGYWFATRRTLLSHLLSPPDPPFVAAFPRYGADHGGESNLGRCVWGGHVPPDPLVRLQSKHCAVYAQTSHDASRYTLQVDDVLTVPVDVDRWRDHVATLTPIARELRDAKVGFTEIRSALSTLRPPERAPLRLVARWDRTVAPLRMVAGAPWWALLVDLLPMPEAMPVPATAPPTVPSPIPIPRPEAFPRSGQLSLWR